MNTTVRMKAIPIETGASSSDQGWKFDEVVTVRRIVSTAALLLVFTLTALGVSTAQGASLSGWHSSFESARNEAQRSGKPLFLLIAKAGCPACAQMEGELARNGRALRGAVKARVESDYNPQLTARFASGGTPTTVIFKGGNYHNPVYTYTGVMDSSTIRQVGSAMTSRN